MKRILTLIFFLVVIIGLQAQTVQTVQPGRTVLFSELDITSIAGADTSVKFRLPEGCSYYSIQYVITDTIEGDTVGLRLYGSNDAASWIQIGTDSLLVDTFINATNTFTGTAFYYMFGKVEFSKLSISEGELNLLLNYKK